MYLWSDLENVKYLGRSVQFYNDKISRNRGKILVTVLTVGFNRYLFKMKLKEHTDLFARNLENPFNFNFAY